jgi:transcriptional antiterminator NusG
MVAEWFVIHTYSGHEDRVKSSLEKAVANLGMQDRIINILVPTEEVVEIKRNKKHFKKRKFFPGYVFANMVMDNESYWLVRNTAGVTGFLGGVKPVPMPEDEVQNLLDTVNAPSGAKPRPAITFEKEENVRIIEGPFKHFIGVVEEVNEEKGKLKVMVTIFGRPTPVELDFLQVEKL